MDCVFCKIVSGEFNSYKVYEDNVCIAFLDINPINNGHVLIVPKKHSINIEDTADEVLSHLIGIVKKMQKCIMEAVSADGVTVVQNNGILQEVKHIHFHLIPVFEKAHGINFTKSGELEDISIIRERIVNLIS